MAPRVLLIGWDGADWKVINQLVEAGAMPNTEALIERGVIGNLATLQPVLSPMLWTSIATGKRPWKHGVLGFTEPDPASGGVRPVTGLSCKTRAIWNLLHLEGMTCNVVGWWPSHPAEPIRGVMVSNHFQRAVGPIDKPWPVRPGTIHPARLVEHLAKLRVHPQELEAQHILPFVPGAAKVDQQKDRRLESLAKILSECSGIHAVATALVQTEPWDFTAVYYDAIDHFSHGFMRYHPPKTEGVSEEDYQMYQGVVEGGYRFHDAMLGALVELAGKETTVILISDHGFHPDHLRPQSIPMEPAGPAVQHRDYGIFLMAGPGVKQDQRIYGASLLDVTPTILSLYGLPVAEDMDGKPLVNAFEQPPAIDTIPSWDEVQREDGTHPPDARLDPVEAQESINQLVALGYIEEPDADREKAVSQTIRELRYNEARAYMDGERHHAAAEILEKLVADWPEESRFAAQLVTCYQALDRIEDARRTIDQLMANRRQTAARAVEKLKTWKQEHADTKPEDLDEKARRELQRLQRQAVTNPFAVAYLNSRQLLAEGRQAEALEAVGRAEVGQQGSPSVHIQKGKILLGMKQWARAEESFQQALDLDPDNAAAYVGLARGLLARRQNQHAATAALSAVGLLFYNPSAHYLLGVALHRMGRVPRAVEALRVCLAQNPNYAAAHERLAYIYEKRLNDPAKAAEHRNLAEAARQRVRDLKEGKLKLSVKQRAERATTSDQDVLPIGEDNWPTEDVPRESLVTVVSGLPRSGTSMMMQMLVAGGIEPLVDDQRLADAHNIKGYYEYTPVKSLRRDHSWLAEARGKVVKIVAPLLGTLPRGKEFNYRIILMQRDLGEVLSSQQDMLVAQGRRGARLEEATLRRTFATQLRRIYRLLAVVDIPVLYVRHQDCLNDPAAVAKRVNRFLGSELDERAMSGVVDPALYRHRDGSKPTAPG